MNPYRHARSLLVLAALIVSAAVATALLTRRAVKPDRDAHSLGANIVLTAPTDAGFPAGALAGVQQAIGPVDKQQAVDVPFAHVLATSSDGTSIVVAGTDFNLARRLGNWQVDTWPPTWRPPAKGSPETPPPALIGQRAAQLIPASPAGDLTVAFAGKQLTLHAAGHLRTGGVEDSRVYIPMEAFTRWTGLSTTAIEVQVPGDAARVESAIASLHRAFPAAQIQPIHQPKP
jgi:putative ABC transport system permease protein